MDSFKGSYLEPSILYIMWRSRKSKFGNKKTIIDGITFHSLKEGARYKELKILVASKRIANLELQVRFPIEVNGKKICTYIADFTYYESPHLYVIEDVKGMRTSIFNLKWKLMQALYPKHTFRIT